jgi:hypothetical protein
VEHHPYAVSRNEPLDVASERLVGLPFDLLPPELGGELRDDPAHHLGRQARPSLGDLLDPLDELVGGRALDQVADGAGPEHLQDVGSVLVRGQSDHPCAGRHARDASSRVRPAPFGHADVHERDVRQVRSGDPDRLLRVGGRADQLDPLLVAEELREGHAESGLVVRQEDADRVAVATQMQDGSVGGHRADATRAGGAAQAPG